MVFQNEIKQGGNEIISYSVGDIRKADIALNRKIRELLEDGVLKVGPISIFRTISSLDLPRRLHQILEFNIAYDGIHLITNKIEHVNEYGEAVFEAAV